MKKFLIILSLFFAGLGLQAQTITFKAQSKKVVALNERFQLTFTVNASGKKFIPPNLNAFNFSGPSTSTNMSSQWINGKMTSTYAYTFTYVLQAKKVGKFTVGSAQIMVKNKKYRTQPITIEVVKSNSNTNSASGSSQQNIDNISDKDLFVRLSLNKNSITQGEHVIATIKIYTRLDLAGFENIKFPNFNGFWTQEIKTPDQIQLTRENVNGTIYNVGVLKKMVLFPQRSGKISIEATEVECVVRKRVRRASFFDSGYRSIKKKTKDRVKQLKVKALPSFGKPLSFKGAVGNLKMTATIDKTKLKTNEAFNLTIKISGNGNLKLIDPPATNFPPDFETYDPDIKNNYKATTNGVVGNKTIKYLMIPRQAGDFKIPALKFSYFNPQTGKYQEVASEEFHIQVEKGDNDASDATVIGDFNKGNVKVVGSDIRFINQNSLELKPIDDFFFGTGLFIGIYVLLSALFTALVLWRKKYIKEQANISLVRNKRANKVSRKRLKTAAAHLKKARREAFFEEILKALWGYLSDKLSIPVADLSKDNVSEKLKERQVDEAATLAFMDLINTCEFACYAPSEASANMEEVYKKAGKFINELEQKIK